MTDISTDKQSTQLRTAGSCANSWQSRLKWWLELALIRVSKRLPEVAKTGLAIWARIDRNMRFHRRWFVTELAKTLDHRIRVRARLVNGMPMEVVWNDFIGAEIYYHGSYEPTSVDLVTGILQPGMIFIDIGAHIGQYTLLASGRVGETGEVHSFEPTPQTFEMLARNVAINNLRNVRINAVALSDTTGSRTLYLSDLTHEGFNSLRPPYQCDSGRSCTVRAGTLDNYVEDNGIRHIDLIKIDVEGAECQVLGGAMALLRRSEPPIILLEFNPGALSAFESSCAALATLLVAHGYLLFIVGEYTLEPYTPAPRKHSVFNVLAVPQPMTASALSRLGRQWMVLE